MQMTATVRAMHEELPTVPTFVAKIVAGYMASSTWEEVGRLTLRAGTPPAI
jgi:hypothetical protein